VQCYRRAIIRLQAAWRHRLACTGEATCRPAMECYRRRQTPATVTSLAPYTMCRRASNKQQNIPISWRKTDQDWSTK